MPDKEQSALLVHRENYIVPKGEEHVVHCKIAKLDAKGSFIERPTIIKTRVKQFDTTSKKGMELNGYTIEILHHPLGKYTNVKIVDKDIELANKDAEIATLKKQLEASVAPISAVVSEKDAEIARLKAEIEAMKKASKNDAPKEEKAKVGRKPKTDAEPVKKEE